MPCDWPGYTQNSFVTPSLESAMCISSLCGRGTRGSPSTTWMKIGVLAFLTYVIGDWRIQTSSCPGSQYILSPRYHWRSRWVSLCDHIETQFATPAPELIALKRFVCVSIQFE